MYAYVILFIQLLVGVVAVGRSLVDRVVAVADQECNQAYRVAAAEDLEQNFPLHVALLHNMYTHLEAIQHFYKIIMLWLDKHAMQHACKLWFHKAVNQLNSLKNLIPTWFLRFRGSKWWPDGPHVPVLAWCGDLGGLLKNLEKRCRSP